MIKARDANNMNIMYGMTRSNHVRVHGTSAMADIARPYWLSPR
jgi:hypothetical protein